MRTRPSLACRRAGGTPRGRFGRDQWFASGGSCGHEARVDRTRLGLKFTEKPRHEIQTTSAVNRRIRIPAGAPNHEEKAALPVPVAVKVLGLMPHMHYRGKYMKYVAEYPDGTSEVLLSVPKYDFNWQFNYQLAEPAFLPAGTRLYARGAMDNSDRNPYNPNPDVPVRFGLQTMHEMFFGFLTLRYVGDTPESILNGGPEGEVAGL